MNLLAIDTATEALSVALQVNGNLFSRFEICPQQHSQKLLPLVDEVLQDAGVQIGELDGLVFGRGPGSFTGVRIATGMIQGLSLGSSLPVVGISTLAAMAMQAVAEHGADKILSATDARMSEVYFGQYSVQSGLVELIGEEVVCAPAEAAEKAAQQGFVAVGTGWQAYPELAACVADAPQILYPQAQYMLALAEQEFRAGRSSDAAGVSPVYLRDKVTWKKLPGRE
ncbi:tRNA (adenosine(37)-N6)-threonylcarbamoyltransferase complex dimerization subunit type 1 TsaB [Salinimonas lutimaris]|uniref:tRNA (adenosine(37)-N6)-threonylcarbamoyltransferase complex dimerization subunit type 1 TsaB n=1 Tax=Salinimonas lutimaris TaxID=914153 RepID=UPI0010C0243B|nr:tRNA (adenosine(37)-N6)-threonylcarbamoyltransferase complex dimerization subunit type 1 TsaB [Salinimonas lutimaris]